MLHAKRRRPHQQGEVSQVVALRKVQQDGQVTRVRLVQCTFAALDLDTDMFVSLRGEVVVALDDGDLLTVQIAKERKAFGVLAYDSDYFFFPDMAGIKLFSNKNRVIMKSLLTVALLESLLFPRACTVPTRGRR